MLPPHDPPALSISNLSRMKAFISTSHLEDLRITLRRRQQDDENDGDETGAADTSAASFDRARLARLLDDLSDDNNEEQGDRDEQGRRDNSVKFVWCKIRFGSGSDLHLRGQLHMTSRKVLELILYTPIP